MVKDTAEITDAANGMVEYTLGGTQTARQGKHRLEFVAEFAGGETYSHPQTGFISLQVTDPAARELPIEELADGDASVTELAADAIRANTASAVDVMDALDLNNNPITSLPVPSNPADAARKDGLDTVASDLSSVESDLTSQVTRFDELAIDRGPISSRPTSGDYDDQMYYAVDQRILWRWDAGSSDWNAAGGLGVSSQRLPVTSYLDAVDVSTLAAGDVNLSGTLTGLLLGDAADVAGNPLQNVDTVTASGTAISVDSPVAGQSPQTETHLTTKGYVDSSVESHRATETHDQPQPNQAHGNEDHNETYITAGDDVDVSTLAAGEIDSAQSVTISDDETVTYGRDHVHPDRGIEPNSVAIGVGARAPDSTGDPGWFNDTANSVAIGYQALRDNTGARSNGVGYEALANNTGANSNGVGYQALQNNTGANSNGVGREALANNTGGRSNGVGYRALRYNTGFGSNGVGYYALRDNTGDKSNGVGYKALDNNTGRLQRRRVSGARQQHGGQIQRRRASGA